MASQTIEVPASYLTINNNNVKLWTVPDNIDILIDSSLTTGYPARYLARVQMSLNDRVVQVSFQVSRRNRYRRLR